MPRIDVLIADDHAIVRDGLRLLLESEPGLACVGEARDGHEAALLACAQAPSVLLMDLQMPGLGGVAAIRHVRESCPATRLLVLSMHEDVRYLRAALAAGAHGYVAKRSGSRRLVQAILAVARGERYVDPALPETLPSADEPASLSAREREVAVKVRAGLTNREIAAELGISKSSVETYRARVFDKLGVSTRAELVERLERAEPGPEPA